MYNNDAEQQKIFVDGEEEITTVVDHLRRCQVQQVILVIPQHAVLLQSVVNLKLLAQEARRMQKHIVIMTNDEDGIGLAQRAGITTKQYSAQELPRAGNVKEQEGMRREQNVVHAASRKIPMQAQNRTIGSPVIHAQSSVMQQPRVAPPRAAGQQREMPVRSQQYAVAQQLRGAAPSLIQKQNGYRHVNNERNGDTYHPHQISPVIHAPQRALQRQSATVSSSGDDLVQYERSLYETRMTSDARRASTAEKAHAVKFNTRPHVSSTPGNITHDTQTVHKKSFNTAIEKKPEQVISSKTRFLVKGFVFGGIILMLLIGLIVILPKSHIIINPKHVAIDDNVELTVRTDQSAADNDRRILPARLIERDITFTKAFAATGSGDAGAQKAQGTITIYNAFDEKPQSLVATTRFLAENGVLFRLVKTVTIPGMKNGEPGKVEALVIADKEGSEGNIAPGKFSIPGFDSGPKKEKIYGVSEMAMAGGGAGGSGVAIVTADDIARAQKEMESEARRYIHEQVTALLRPDSEMLLPDAMRFDTVRSEANVSAETMKEEFMYEIVAHVQAIVFVQDDILSVVEDVFADDLALYGVEQPDIKLAYQNIVSNFEDRTVKMTVHGSTVITAQVDVDAFKKDILGKKHDDLLAVIESRYEKTIDKIIIQSVVPSAPVFIAGRVSPLSMMTDIIVDD